jgi:hypothetical protein
MDEIISYKMCAVKVAMQNCGITLGMLFSQPWIYMHQLKQSKLGAASTHSLRPTRKNS